MAFYVKRGLPTIPGIGIRFVKTESSAVACDFDPILNTDNTAVCGCSGFTAKKRRPTASLFIYSDLFEHACDLFAEVVLFLLKTLAALITPESRKSDLAAEFLRGVLYILTDRHGIVLNVSLFGKAVLFVELSDLSGNHLLDDLLGLVCVLLVIFDLSGKNFFLGVNISLRNRFLVEVKHGHSGNLKRDILGKCLESGVLLASLVSVKLDDNAGGAVTVDVGAEHALDDNEAADVHVLTDSENHILELAFNGEVGVKILESKKSFNICGLVAENSPR